MDLYFQVILKNCVENIFFVIKNYSFNLIKFLTIFLSQLITLQTSNLLLLIRCYTKYIIEIENETALLEQLNYNTLMNEKDTSSQLQGD